MKAKTITALELKKKERRQMMSTVLSIRDSAIGNGLNGAKTKMNESRISGKLFIPQDYEVCRNNEKFEES